ncbi:MAG: acetolactate synthase small subunit [Oscillospiraceae bacterium]|jgi:acetolactate synthase-1/3 small subunit|nr:acetolactate synthase small subunit [Oscillospiraceae bacterium]
MSRNVLSVLVDNHAGVLARVSSLFGRRGFNIDSLSVSATDDAGLSRVTIVVRGDATELEQILRQTEKLTETRAVFHIEPGMGVLRELLLVKVGADEATRPALREIATVYKAKIIDLSPGSMIFELTGEPEKIDAFLEMLAQHPLLEMCRTGITALQRGEPRYKLKKSRLPDALS